MKSLPNTSPNILGGELWTEKRGYWKDAEKWEVVGENLYGGLSIPILEKQISKVWTEETTDVFIF